MHQLIVEILPFLFLPENRKLRVVPSQKTSLLENLTWPSSFRHMPQLSWTQELNFNKGGKRNGEST
jgi:hypothetical protein